MSRQIERPASARAARALVVLASAATSACMPDSVQAVDAWLSGLEAGDTQQVVRWSHPEDRELVAQGLHDRATDPTSTAALALPPTPIDHYFVGIDHKSPDGTRHVVQTELTLKNPLPFASEKVGQKLEGIPETRKLTRRFLSVRTEEGWRVQLDLPAVVARARFAEAFQAALDEARWADAQAMLDAVPPPPDDPESQRSTDRMAQALAAALAEAQKTRTSTVALPKTDDSASSPPDP